MITICSIAGFVLNIALFGLLAIEAVRKGCL